MIPDVRLVSLEIRGFRSFGTEARVFQLDAPLVVVHAGNSQGKTSLAEAVEFLISGRSSRRDLLGGAKAEYHNSLRNAHLPKGDDDVYVQATVRTADGRVLLARRELTCDFGQGTECESRLLIDGSPATDLAEAGLLLADAPLRAPVLLQHTLRFVLSSEPKQRVDFFKALLSLTDLDLLRSRVAALCKSVQVEQPGPVLRVAQTLASDAAGPAFAGLGSLTQQAKSVAEVTTAVDGILLDAGAALLGKPRSETVEDLAAEIAAVQDEQRETAFPLKAFALSAGAPTVPSLPSLDAYSDALAAADRDAARLAPLISAVLSHDDYADLGHAVDCPVCATQAALTPERMNVLRDQLCRTEQIDTAATMAAGALDTARHDIARLFNGFATLAPTVAGWDSGQRNDAAARLQELGIDPQLAIAAYRGADGVVSASTGARAAAEKVLAALTSAADAVGARTDLIILASEYEELALTMDQVATAVTRYQAHAATLQAAVEPTLRERTARGGLMELADLISRRKDLAADITAEGARQQAVNRLKAAESALKTAAGHVLDSRFDRMSEAVNAWWKTIRPEELVDFAGVKRRAGGALFVNLVAALHADSSSDPVERDALGVYSDSQLNALGLAIFLARAQLLATPVLVLDDPIPGSDAEHRLTFVQNTLRELLDSGTQIILTTFDNKLAEYAHSSHDWREPVGYELNLIDAITGTEATQTSDQFSQFLLQAADNINAPTAAGRRTACGALRSAAERLAKQIIATGRTAAGQVTTVADIQAEAQLLRELVPLVNSFALDKAEPGKWRTFSKVLNPGNHDDEAPPTSELRQVRGDLRAIAKAHSQHWPGGLLR